MQRSIVAALLCETFDRGRFLAREKLPHLVVSIFSITKMQTHMNEKSAVHHTRGSSYSSHSCPCSPYSRPQIHTYVLLTVIVFGAQASNSHVSQTRKMSSSIFILLLFI